jgi:hypothetical protein
MLELGIKPPSRFWVFDSDYPFSVSAALAVFLLTCSSLGLYFTNDWVDDREQTALAEAPSSDAALAITSVLANAVLLSQTGKVETLTEITEIAQQLRGETSEREEITLAIEQMMKGVNVDQFFKLAGEGLQPPQPMTRAGDGNQSFAVSTSTLEGITGLEGAPVFDAEERLALSPPLLAHGSDQLFKVLNDQSGVPLTANADGVKRRVPVVEGHGWL